MKQHLALTGSYGNLHGELVIPEQPRGLVIVAHAHRIAVNDASAKHLLACGYALLGSMLLSEREMHFPDATQDVGRLTRRLLDVIELSNRDESTRKLPLGLLVGGEVTPAAIRAAAQRDARVAAIAALGGNADRAGLQALGMLTAPLLMLFDASTAPTAEVWERVRQRIAAPNESHILNPGDKTGERIADWLQRHMPPPEPI